MGQTVSASGVNAHFQNGVAENQICTLQDAARTMLVHAKHQWPKAINAHLWPYAIQFANDVHMHTPAMEGKMPFSLFSIVGDSVPPKHFHPFGCPVYILSAWMQGNSKGPKWDECTRVGINLGNSPLHARSITIVLNIETGLASPQFHIKFDGLFETVHTFTFSINWHKQTGFVKTTADAPMEPPVPDSFTLPPQNAIPSNEAPAAHAQPQSNETAMAAADTAQDMTASEGVTSAPTEIDMTPETLPPVDSTTPALTEPLQMNAPNSVTPSSASSCVTTPTLRMRTRTIQPQSNIDKMSHLLLRPGTMSGIYKTSRYRRQWLILLLLLRR
jgi:hypothetical protein